MHEREADEQVLRFIQPALGRFYTSQEDAPPAGTRVAVLGYGYWQTAFGGRADVLGRQLYVGNAVYTVIGVAPRDFIGITEGAAPALFVPVTAAGYAREPDYADSYGWSWLEVIVRRKPDVTLDAASTDIAAVKSRDRDALYHVTKVACACGSGCVAVWRRAGARTRPARR